MVDVDGGLHILVLSRCQTILCHIVKGLLLKDSLVEGGILQSQIVTKEPDQYSTVKSAHFKRCILKLVCMPG